MPGYTIGCARSLMGGDMNTAPHAWSQLLQIIRNKRQLYTKEQICETVFAQHGDVCVFGGFNACCLNNSADNHDPQHSPYGISWCIAEDDGTEQNRSSTSQRAASSTNNDPQQSNQAASNLEGLTTGISFVSSGKKRDTQDAVKNDSVDNATEQHGSSTLERAASSSKYDAEQSKQVAPSPEAARSARLELQSLQTRAEHNRMTEGDIKRELEDLHVMYGTFSEA